MVHYAAKSVRDIDPTRTFQQRSVVTDGRSVQTPLSAVGGWTSYQIFKKEVGDLTGFQFLEGIAKKEGRDFFHGVRKCSFYIKNKLKSEVFNNKISV